MQKRSSKGKKQDIHELASTITGQTTDPQPEGKPDYGNKNPAAVKLRRKGGLKGGKVRAKMITARQRSDAAREAAVVRCSSNKKLP